MDEFQQHINRCNGLVIGLENAIGEQVRYHEYVKMSFEGMRDCMHGDKRTVDSQSRAREYNDAINRYQAEEDSYTKEIMGIGASIYKQITHFNSIHSTTSKHTEQEIARLIMSIDKICFHHQKEYKCSSCGLEKFRSQALLLLFEELQKNPADTKLKQDIAQRLLKDKGSKEAVAFLNTEISKYPEDKDLRNDLQTIILERLSSKDDSIRQSSIDYLLEYGDQSAVLQLNKLYDEEQQVNRQIQVLQVLVKIQGSKSFNSLFKGLVSDKPEVSLYASRKLCEMNIPDIVYRLVNSLQTEKNSAARKAIISTLGELDSQPRKWWEKLQGARPWAK